VVTTSPTKAVTAAAEAWATADAQLFVR
jgi:hypothetical protein